eukprot:TRINITY_DN2259_c0_g2_i1.p1 TRINITY_DN2259_c0_g2~~TRINITY_DN2259_c0_g2_i1.p1  ORF type:complete len:398 (-),score=62.45 TRINITY_DN2259_c0_g2_i1:539-1672(-)
MTQEGAHIPVLQRLNKLFMDEESKDVTFKLADGEQRAHRLILQSASDVFKGMFGQDMREKQQGVVNLPEVDTSSMRVFLRLIYTGHIDESDFAQPEEQSDLVLNSKPLRISKQAGFDIDGPRLRSSGASWAPGLLVDAELDRAQFSVSCRGSAGPAMIGLAPSNTQLGQSIHGRGAWIYVQHGRIDCTYPGSQPVPVQTPVGPSSKVTIAFEKSSNSLVYSVDGGTMQVARTVPAPPEGAHYQFALNVPNKGIELDVELKRPCVGPPLDTLISVAILSKKYMVQDLLSLSVRALKARLECAKENACVRSFEAILCGAMSSSLDPVRLAALKLAEDFTKLRQSYDAGELKPEIMHELEAIWPPAKAMAKDSMSFVGLE